MSAGNEIIFVAGVLSLLAVLAGLASARIGTPLLLALIGVGMLAGEDGPGGIPFNNFQAAYLIGSLALAVILFQGGLNTERSMLRKALWPSVVGRRDCFSGRRPRQRTPQRGLDGQARGTTPLSARRRPDLSTASPRQHSPRSR